MALHKPPGTVILRVCPNCLTVTLNPNCRLTPGCQRNDQDGTLTDLVIPDPFYRNAYRVFREDGEELSQVTYYGL